MAKLFTKTDKVPAEDDYIYISSVDGTVDGKVQLKDITAVKAVAHTVNFTSSQTATEIQASINAVPKYIPYGTAVTFKFANGTYTLNAQLAWVGFFGEGTISIIGDTTQTTGLHTGQNVHLDFSTANANNLFFWKNDVYFSVQQLKVTTKDGYISFLIDKTRYAEIFYCYIIHIAKTSTLSRAIHLTWSMGKVQLTYFNNNNMALSAWGSSVLVSNTNDDTGTQPSYALRAGSGAELGKANLQPTGSIANELAANGGAIH